MRLRVPGARALAARRDRLVQRWLDRRVPPEGPRIRIHRRRLFILPTSLGYTFGLTVAVLLLGSLNYQTSLGFAITFWLGGIGALGMVHTYRNLEGMTLTFAPAPAVFAGEMARFPVALDAGPRPRWALQLAGGAATPVEQLAPLPGTALRSEVALPTTTRGRVRLPRLVLRSRWPLALFRTWSWLAPRVEGLAYPAPVDHGRPFPAVGTGAGRGRPARGGDEDFAGLREYQPGDPPRRIAWKALARTDELRVKNFEGEPAGDIWLAWETVETLPLEARFEQLCCWILQADADGRRYGLRLPDTQIMPGSGPAHCRTCLEALALSTGRKT